MQHDTIGANAGPRQSLPPFLGLKISPLCSVVAGGVMISFSAVFAKLAQVEPDVAGFYRVFVGGLALAIVSILQHKTLRMPRSVLPFALSASLCLALDLACWHRSILAVGPGLATILINFQVFVLALAGRAVLREPLSPRLLVAAPLALAGLWLLAGVDVSGTGGGMLGGVLLGLAAAAWFGGYTFLVRISQSAPEAPDPVPGMAVISLATALPLLAICWWGGNSPLDVPTATDAGWLLAYGVISQGLGWLLISRGLPYVSAAVAGLAILIMPTLSFIWDIVFFGRPAGPVSLAGAVLALAAIRLGMSNGKPQDKTPAQ
ncbi:DMT family transporter [Desulfocurvus sp. DL9XJH121]